MYTNKRWRGYWGKFKEKKRKRRTKKETFAFRLKGEQQKKIKGNFYVLFFLFFIHFLLFTICKENNTERDEKKGY